MQGEPFPFYPCRHSRQLDLALSDRSSHFASTFLRPLAPRALPRFNATMDALTPAPAALRTLPGHEHRLIPEQVSLLYTIGLPAVLPSTTSGPRLSLSHVTLHRNRPPVIPRFWTSLFLRQLVSPCGRIRFPLAADRQFVSRCSPHRLSTTQLRSASGRRTFARDGLPPSKPMVRTGARRDPFHGVHRCITGWKSRWTGWNPTLPLWTGSGSQCVRKRERRLPTNRRGAEQ